MLVFSDRERRCDPRAALEELARAIDELMARAPGDGDPRLSREISNPSSAQTRN